MSTEKGEGPPAVDSHDSLFTASAVEALSSQSTDRSEAKSLKSGVWVGLMKEALQSELHPEETQWL